MFSGSGDELAMHRDLQRVVLSIQVRRLAEHKHIFLLRVPSNCRIGSDYNMCSEMAGQGRSQSDKYGARTVIWYRVYEVIQR